MTEDPLNTDWDGGPPPNPENDLRAIRAKEAELEEAALVDDGEGSEGDQEPDPAFVDHEPVFDRPVIQITSELHNTITAACEAIAGDRNIFARDGALVDVVRASASDADTYVAVGAPKIRSISLPTMRERLTRAAIFEKKNVKKKEQPWEPTIPPDNVPAGVLARGQYPGIRPIVGILEAPSLRPDGSIIQQRGYDVRTGYLYEPSVAFPEIPDAPSQVDAVRALKELNDVFSDFPFATEASRSAVVAAILTILVRPCILGAVPAFIVDASTRGTGKSLTTDLIGVIATGRCTAKMSWPADDIELEKVLGGYAMRGAMIVNFDNVVRPFGGGPLDRCLTAVDTVELRVLGTSSVPEVLWRATVLATGNNVTLTGDTARRSVIIRLESPLEHPEDREDFKIANIIEYCRTERPRLVVAGLTLLRAWFVASRPNDGASKRWGSFEAWSEVIPRALVFAGGANPLDARPAATDQEEPEKAALIGLLDGLLWLDPDRVGMTCKDVIAKLYPPLNRGEPRPPDGGEGFRDAIEFLTPGNKQPTSKSLGASMKRAKRRVIGGRCLDCRAGHAGTLLWFTAKR